MIRICTEKRYWSWGKQRGVLAGFFYDPGHTSWKRKDIVVVLFILLQIILSEIRGRFGFFLTTSPWYFIRVTYDKQEIFRGYNENGSLICRHQNDDLGFRPKPGCFLRHQEDSVYKRGSPKTSPWRRLIFAALILDIPCQVCSSAELISVSPEPLCLY